MNPPIPTTPGWRQAPDPWMAWKNTAHEATARIVEMARKAVSEERKRIALSHPILFGKVYTPWAENETPDFHWEMSQIAMTMNRSAFCAPRSFAKTTVMTKFLNCWSAFSKSRCNEIILLSASANLAENWLAQIKGWLETNEEILEDFGDLRGDRWGDSDLELLFNRETKSKWRRVTMRARGRGCQVRGMRPYLGIVDDIDNEETVNSEKMREDLWEWFWGAWINIFDTPEKHLSVVGTAISEHALIVKLMAAKRRGWFCKSYEALSSDGRRSLWPSRWPVEELEKRRDEIGVAAFAAEFLNAPLGRHGKSFTHKHIQVGDGDRVQRAYTSMTVDPAASGLGDPWAITIVDQSPEGVWHVQEAIERQEAFDKLIEMIFKMHELYRPRVIGVETAAFQHSMKYILEDQSRRRGIHLPLVTISNTNRKTKHMRIMELLPLFEAGRIVLKRSQTALREQILDYPRGHDDLLDSLAMHLEVSRSPYAVTPLAARPEGMTMKQIREWGTEPANDDRYARFLPY